MRQSLTLGMSSASAVLDNTLLKPTVSEAGSDNGYEFEAPINTAQYNRHAQEVAKKRMRLIMRGFGMLGAVFVVRLASLGMAYEAPAEAQLTPVIASVEAPSKAASFARLDIYDRNQQILATSLEVSELGVDPDLVKEPEKMAAAIVEILPNLSLKRVLKAFRSKAPYVRLAGRLTPTQAYQIHALGYPALRLESREKRIYPQGRLAAHVLGYVNVDGDGLAGVEYAQNDLLTKSASLTGYVMDQQAGQKAQSALSLSIDMNVQHALADELASVKNAYEAKGAAGIVMDVNSGEIIAMASLPDFDPNVGRGAEPAEKRNRATQDVYELGSTMKTFTFAAALDYGLIKMDDTFDARKPLTFGRFTIHDDHAQNRILTAPEVYTHSSNIGTTKIAEIIGEERQQAFLRSLGLFDKPELEIAETARPLVPDVWRQTTLATVSYGHGMSLSPLHLVRGMAAMVNGGYLVKPTLIKGGSTLGERVIGADTSRQIRQLLRLNVLKGTGKNADAKGYRVAGKTGTSRKVIDGEYSRSHILASFVAAFPIDDPKYVVYVMVDEPQDKFKSGGMVAAPVVKNTIERIAPLLAIAPAKEDLSPYKALFDLVKED